MLFLDELFEECRLFHLAMEVQITGRLDLRSLRLAFDSVVARHRILACRIVTVGTAVAWEDAPSLKPEFAIVDVSGLGEGVDLACRRVFDWVRARSFSGSAWLRAAVCICGGSRYRLLVVRHHIVSDGWSFAILGHDIAAYYRAACQGDTATLPPLPMQFHDYCRQLASAPPPAEDLDFWAGELAGSPHRIDFRRGVSKQVDDVASVALSFTDREMRLVTRALPRPVTRFTVLLGVFGLLLYRLTGQRDLPIGTDATCRNHPDLENTVGLFVNRIVLRLRVNPEATLAEFLCRAQDTVTAALGRRQTPFSQVARRVRPGARGVASPLFNVLFGMHNNPHNGLSIEGPVCRHVASSSAASSELDLCLYIADYAAYQAAELTYRPALFARSEAVLMCDEYVSLLRELPARLDQRIGEVMAVRDDVDRAFVSSNGGGVTSR